MITSVRKTARHRWIPSYYEFATHTEYVRRGCFASFVLERTQPDKLRQMLLERNPATAG